MALTVPVPLALGRFKRLPQRSTEVWQGGLVRMPMWIDNPEHPHLEPYRPVGSLWVSLGAGLLHLDLPEEGIVASPQLALATLLEFGLKIGGDLMGRPIRIEVTDAALREVLGNALAPLNTTVSVVPDMPAVREALQVLEAGAAHGVRTPGLLESPGVSAEDVRSFAEAAALFYSARPWDHLANADLIVLESPSCPRALQHICVLGRGGQEFGLAFHASRADFERMLDPSSVNRRPPTHACGVTFGPKHDLPFADVDAWEDLQLPVAAAHAYPLAGDLFQGGRMTRPTRAELHHMEALLRAIAATTEADLDTGRWTCRVITSGGSVHMTLSLPLLLEAESGEFVPTPRFGHEMTGERAMKKIEQFLQAQSFDSLDNANAALGQAMQTGLFDAPSDGQADRAATPLQRAQELAYDALEATGRRRIKLARTALALSPDCADAWMVLAESASTPEAALPSFERALEAGARAIGTERFVEVTGSFWSHIDTRPYMRARLALAGTLRLLGRTEEALAHYRDMLRLNPGDNQGVRYVLLPALLEDLRDDEVGTWLDRYPDDAGATVPYARLLWHYRKDGDSPHTRAALAEAVALNPHVIGYLLDADGLPIVPLDYFTLGSKEEASSVAEDLFEAFARTDGVLAWLGVHGPAAVRRHRGARRKPRRRPSA
jgi:tetratricopeptide (TPR) repeat protein